MAQAILLEDVDTLGARGDIVDVSPGYLRNFLLPRKLAQPATKGALAVAAQLAAQGENASKYLSKGRPVAIDGRLEWREFTDKDGNNRQAIEIVADSVQFLGSREGGGENGGRFTPQSDVPADTGDFEPAPMGGGGGSGGTTDDDIPF